MSYVSTTFTEVGVLDEFESLLTNNGWTKKERFKKVAFTFPNLYPTNSPSNPGETPLNIYIAEHIIFENSVNNLYGVARISKVKKKWKDLPGTLSTNSVPNASTYVADKVKREELHSWLVGQYDPNAIDTSEIYFYMLNKLPNIPTGTVVYPATTDTDLIKSSLDVENLSYNPTAISTGGGGYKYEEDNPDYLVMQSPMMKVKTRETGTLNNGWLTNWWPDSKIRVEGLVSNKTVSLIIHADNTAAYDDNNVPTIPIYLGQLTALDPADTNEAVLFGGTAINNAKFDYTDTKPLVTDILMPIAKAYPKNPGNGIDNIIVKRAKYGAYYQAYYLSFQTAPDTMPPDRVSTDGKQYVSAWKNERNDEYLFKFNPSSYTKKSHVSRGYVIHPEEGVRGYLTDMIMASSVGLMNNDRLKLKKEACPDAFEIYKYFVVDAVSPLTKRPATPFSPIGFGIFEKEA